MDGTGISQGYVTDAGYAETFFRELSPAWLNYVAALNGAPARDLDQPFAYLELGCGFGGSAIVNAGAFPHGSFHACDINPAHVEGGTRQAAALGIGNIRFLQGAFVDLLSLDLPSFDFIALHGVYSWVGADARAAIRRVIHKGLKPGGLVYISYNCLPGWANEAPLRKLLVELAASADGGSPQRAERALHALEILSRVPLRYFKSNASAVAAIASYGRRPSNYLAHEFLNQTWEPFYSVDVADEMREADLSYLGSATLADNHPALVVDAASADAVAKLATDRQRRLAMDFAANRRFRRDVFVRAQGQTAHTGADRSLDAIPIGSPGNPRRIGTKARVPRGEVSFQADFIGDLASLMQRGSMRVRDIVTALGGDGRSERDIARNLTFLVAAGALMPFGKVYQRREPLALRRVASPLARRVLEQAVAHGVPQAIPSEVLGNGLLVQPLQSLAIEAWLEGAQDVEALTARLRTTAGRLDSAVPDTTAEVPADRIKAVAGEIVEDLVPTLVRLGLIS